MTPAMRGRTLAGLARLRALLETEMPVKTRSDTLVMGTWNIRNFDSNGFGNGHRTAEDLLYIAEIIARFDILAVQEICEDLAPLDRLMDVLGPDYDYIVTDKTEGVSGNGERLGFIFDTAKIRFLGIAGELVLPDSGLIEDRNKERQFARTPFMCSFQAGWFRFMFSTVHIYFGKDTGALYARRVAEIRAVARFLAKRAKKDESNHVLVGDFNIKLGDSKGANALADAGFTMFQNRTGSNMLKTKFYDQISFMSKSDHIRVAIPDQSNGVLDFFASIYRAEDFQSYRDALRVTLDEKIVRLNQKIAESGKKIPNARTESVKEKHRKSIASNKEKISDFLSLKDDDVGLMDYYLDEWRTFHGSDHLPLWVNLKVDFSDAYLARQE